jgi:hypothetical protein
LAILRDSCVNRKATDTTPKNERRLGGHEYSKVEGERENGLFSLSVRTASSIKFNC